MEMKTTTFDEILDTVMLWPLDQQEMLVEILHRRHIASRRQEIAHDAQASIALFRSGQLTPQPIMTFCWN